MKILKWLVLSSFFLTQPFLLSQQKPNVILILTDDQGYGDWGHKGQHPYLKTPNMDKLATEGIYCSNFHTNVLCAPSRAAIMTGHDAFKMRVWQGRHEMRTDYPTMANIFEDNGYRTALFGKWHLGDSYPFRPNDRGFQETVRITSGMVTTSADYPGNNLFDDHYLHNEKWEKYQGYSTDVWFGEAIKYIEKKKDENFFIYLSVDAPHAPHRAPDADKAPYINIDYPNTAKDETIANFYGQVASVDRNLKVLRDKLEELNIADNTILIFMSDNGSAAASGVWNGGVTGGKASSQEGGHRVPFFVYWKNGNLTGGREIKEVTSHMDIVPSLISMCNLTPPQKNDFDGIDLLPILKGDVSTLPERTIFNRYSTAEEPPTAAGGCVTRGDFRLFYSNGQLYNVSTDLAQQNNLGFDPNFRPVKDLMVEHANQNIAFLQQNAFNERSVPVVGSSSALANPVSLHAVTAYKNGGNDNSDKIIAWHNSNNNPTGLVGYWYIRAAEAAEYKISLYRWSKVVQVPLRGKSHPTFSTALDIRKARIIVTPEGMSPITKEVNVSDSDIFAELTVNLPKDKEIRLEAHFLDPSGNIICSPIETEVFKPLTTPSAPVANTDNYTVSAGGSLSKSANEGILANDEDANGDNFSAVLVSTTTNGTLNLSADGSFTYSPNNGFSGIDSFHYKASDGSLQSSAATVNIEVSLGGLVGYWKFDESSGLSAQDESGNNLTGSVKNGVLVNQPGKKERSFKFDGSAGKVILPDVNSLDFSGKSFTFAMWVNPAVIGGTQGLLGASQSNSPVIFSLIDSGKLQIGKAGFGGQAAGASTGVVSANEWTHVAATRNISSKQVTYYINGVAAGSGVWNNDGLAGATTSSIGRERVNFNSFNGYIDDVRIYDSVLTSSDISNLFSGTPPSNTAPQCSILSPANNSSLDSRLLRITVLMVAEMLTAVL